MPYYRRMGDVPPKRHTMATADGARLHEELMGLEGFSNASALLYHRHSPSAIVAAKQMPSAPDSGTYDGALEPRHLRTFDLPIGGDPVLGRVTLLENDEVTSGRAVGPECSARCPDAPGDALQ